MYTIIAGVPPFYAETEADRVKKILEGKWEMQGPIWFDVSEECKDLIKKMMAPELIDRPHAANAVNHPWFKKAAESDVILSLEHLQMFTAKEKLKQALIGFFASCIRAPRMYEKFVDTYTTQDKSNMGYMYMKDFMNLYKSINGYNYDEDELNAILQ